MTAKEIYLTIKKDVTKGLYAYDDQIAAIAKWVESEFEPKQQGQSLPIDSVIVPKGTFYCDCVQPSMQKPISETEYECFDCGKEVKQ